MRLERGDRSLHVLFVAGLIVGVWGFIAYPSFIAIAAMVIGGCLMGMQVAVMVGVIGVEKMTEVATGGHADRPAPNYSKIESVVQRGRYEDAMHEWKQLLREYPGDVKAYNGMIDIALRRLDDVDRADEVIALARGDGSLKPDALEKLVTRVETVKSRRFLTDDEDDELD